MDAAGKFRIGCIIIVCVVDFNGSESTIVISVIFIIFLSHPGNHRRSIRRRRRSSRRLMGRRGGRGKGKGGFHSSILIIANLRQADNGQDKVKIE